ncbi:MAG: glycosyltransferase family 39 protein [Comamonadaceae bacterium]|nr:glycosyltransferase family 39 protein [Comamonadaceae bacterium]
MGNKSKKEKVQDGVYLQEVRKTESGFLKNETIKSHLMALALIGFSAILAYANSLNGTWALDDVVINRPISIQDFQDLLGFRKITYLTFLANQRVASFSAMNFRIVNIVIHLANAILLYILTFWTVRSFLAGRPAAGNNRAVAPDGETFNQRHHDRLAFAAALLCSALFALHPINVSAVAYIVQRMALLAAFFVLLALLFYRAAAESTHYARSSLLFMLCGASLLLGLFSKENAVMGLPLILLYDYVFLSKKDMRSFKKRLAVIGVLAVLVLGVTAYSLRLTHVVADLASLVAHYDQPMEDRGMDGRRRVLDTSAARAHSVQGAPPLPVFAACPGAGFFRFRLVGIPSVLRPDDAPDDAGRCSSHRRADRFFPCSLETASPAQFRHFVVFGGDISRELCRHRRRPVFPSTGIIFPLRDFSWVLQARLLSRSPFPGTGRKYGLQRYLCA